MAARPVRLYLLSLVALLCLGVTVLLVIDTARGATLSAGDGPDRRRVGKADSRALAARCLAWFRRAPGVTVVDLAAGPPPVLELRLARGTASAAFVSNLRGLLGGESLELAGWRVEEGAGAPLVVTVRDAASGAALVLRAGWARGDGHEGARGRGQLGEALAGERRFPRERILPGERDLPRDGGGKKSRDDARDPGAARARGVRAPDGAARIAIVLDDAGLDGAGQWRFLALPHKLAFAVLPNGSQSHAFAQRARDRGYEVLLHAPMLSRGDAREYTPDGKIRLFAPGLQRRDVVRLFDWFLRSVPGAVGVNNHQGSLATADENLMGLVGDELKKRGLWFLDSRTHADSVAFRTMRTRGLRAASRDVFLDHEVDVHTIRERLYEAARLAAERGSALAIGHVTHEETYRVLLEHLPALERLGYRIVPPSALLEGK